MINSGYWRLEVIMLGELGLTSMIIGNRCVDEWETISLDNKAE